jgi:excisionase family DNA binding protein
MTRRRPNCADAQSFTLPAEDKLTRLIRTIARQAAQEVFKALRDAQEAPASPVGTPSDPLIPQGTSIEAAMSESGRGIGSAERFFSVAEIADQLGLSQKSIRRKVANGELTAIRIGKLQRISEYSRADYIARARLSNDQKK